jgi:probable HAF family extracellular repeat protein
MIDLGPGFAPAINNRGQILLQQFIANPDDPNRCFLRDGEKLTDLGTPEGRQCFASDLNNRGQAVGTIQRFETSFPFHVSHAFLWDSGRLIDLGSLGGDWSTSIAINDRGQVVGGSATPDFGGEHAFLWEAGRMTDLGAPRGSSRAFAINNRGQVALSSGSHVYLWEAGSLTDLGTLGGIDDDPPSVGGTLQVAYPLDMNERGQILVAVYDVPAGVFRYGVWASGTVTPLPTLGSGLPSAGCLNNRGDVVGTDRTGPSAADHMVLWSRGTSAGDAP